MSFDLQFWMRWAAGAAAYLLVMQFTPIRRHLRDGARIVQRYPALWTTLALFAFSHAALRLGWRHWGETATLPLAPTINQWNAVWHGLTPGVVGQALQASLLPAWESVAEIFDSPRSTYPLSAVAALLFLFNWKGFHGHFRTGLRRLVLPWPWLRWLGPVLHAGFLLCVAAAFLKPLLLLIGLPALGETFQPAFLLTAAAGLDWLSGIFETFFGIGVQLYLLLIAHAWVHGIGFEPMELRAFTVRRFSTVMQWAVVMVLANTLFIHAPLLAALLPQLLSDGGGIGMWDLERATQFVDSVARPAIAALTLLLCTLEISLALHALSLRESLRAHGLFLRLYPWRVAWFITIAFGHFYALEVLSRSGAAIFATSGGFLLLWKLVMPLLHASLAAWLLGAWVSLYKTASEKEPGALVPAPLAEPAGDAEFTPAETLPLPLRATG